MSLLNLDDYFNRVGLKSSPSISETGLHELHIAQFYVIPFENLNIHLGLGINVDSESIIQKLIYKKRGGYCFELNGLMLLVLNELGFRARPLLARVHMGNPPSGRTHQLNLVVIKNRKWIIDVGFGAGGFRNPIPLEVGEYKQDANVEIRLSKHSELGWLYETKEKDVWKESYSFELATVIHSDIVLGNHFTTTSSLAHFTKVKTASLPTKNGRISLNETLFTRIDNGDITKRYISKDHRYLSLLKSEFGIELDVSFEEFKPLY